MSHSVVSLVYTFGFIMDLQLSGKTALVLAASKGLGRASAMALAAEGADVVIGARNKEQLDKTADEIRAASKVNVHAVTVDVRDTGGVENFVAIAAEKFGKIDILVNNAGGPPFGLFESFDDQAWQEAFELNLLSVVRFSRLVVPHMRKTGSGRIINITSLSVKTFLPGSVLSTSLRMGVVGVAKMLSNELGKDNITVNNIAPGFILTDRIKETLFKDAKAGEDAEVLLAERVKDIPLKRIGKPEELGALVAFLASPLAAYITGTTIQIDGGAVKAPY
ncbi:MAG TPA: SDR family oxidoreductase [Puia sp.]|nr:SDR family oxidoreductase [Puia sp.]